MNRYPTSGTIDVPGGLIAALVLGSPATRAGVRAGMRVVAVDGDILRDVIDWMWLSAENEIELTLEDGDQGLRACGDDDRGDRGDRGDEPGAPSAPSAPAEPSELGEPTLVHLVLTRECDEPWGIEFASPLFDGLRTCVNACTFCFMNMLPRGLRPALYARDDDYRLSFLQGNFVTLTNMREADVRRVIDYRLSPLHVSLHAVSAQVRRVLMGANHARGLEALDALLAADIEVHAQVVAMPGVNDGAELDATLDFCQTRPGILSVGVVPYGYTRYARLQQGFDAGQARRLIAQCASHGSGDECVDERVDRRGAHLGASPNGQRFDRRGAHLGASPDGHLGACNQKVQLADEFFLLADAPLPPAAYYGDFSQYEDGIGMVRSFIDEFADFAEKNTLRKIKSPVYTQDMPQAAPILVTGIAFAPILRELLATNGVRAHVVAIRNDFFGGNVDVAGLLTARDIIEQLPALITAFPAPDSPVLLPDVMFNDDGLTLDDKTAADLSTALHRPVCVVSCTAQGLWEYLTATVAS
ncbi:MAG: DUF512 domain-containing protein [Coriobacteriales bacterium]|jgi:NifB/MoaA-like Fe-S oxidoreductase|nr:DUF512 domain-containing protein [Coriobacteriales bacterium]